MTTVLQRSVAIAVLTTAVTLGYGADPAASVDRQTTGNVDLVPAGTASVDSAAASAQQAYGEEVKKLFATNCSLCHQGNGMRQGDGPKLAGTAKSEEEVIDRIKHGKTPMPAFEGKLSDQQIRALARYIKSLPAG